MDPRPAEEDDSIYRDDTTPSSPPGHHSHVAIKTILSLLFPTACLVLSLLKTDVLSVLYLLVFLSPYILPDSIACKHKFRTVQVWVVLATAVLSILAQVIWQVILETPGVIDVDAARPGWLVDFSFSQYTTMGSISYRLLPDVALFFYGVVYLNLFERLLGTQHSSPSSRPTCMGTELPATDLSTGASEAVLLRDEPSSAQIKPLITVATFFCGVFSALLAFLCPSILHLIFLAFSCAHSISWALCRHPSFPSILKIACWGQRFIATCIVLHYVSQFKSLQLNPDFERVTTALVGRASIFYLMEGLLLAFLLLARLIVKLLCPTPDQEYGEGVLVYSGIWAWTRILSKSEQFNSFFAQFQAHLIELSVFAMFLVGFNTPSLPSLLWISMFCVGLLTTRSRFKSILTYALIVSWVFLIAQTIVTIPYLFPPSNILSLLGSHQTHHLTWWELLFRYSVLWLVSVTQHSYRLEEVSNPLNEHQGADQSLLAPLIDTIFSIQHSLGKPRESKHKERLFQVMGWVLNTALGQCKNMVLVLMFLIGLGSITLINMVYILFFCIFLIWSDVARVFWGLVVAYTVLSALSRYVYLAVAIAFELESSVDLVNSGFSRYATTWDILIYFLLLFLLVLQLEIFRFIKCRPQRVADIPYLRTQHTLCRLACFVSFLLFGLTYEVSMITFGYLCIFIMMMPLTAMTRKRWRAVRLAWHAVATYTMMVVVASYLYQFEKIEEFVVDCLQHVGLSPGVTGLHRFPHLMWGMLPWSVALGLTVYKSWLLIQISIKQAQDPHRQSLADIPSTHDGEDNGTLEDSPSGITRKTREALWWIKRFCIVVVPKTTICALFIASISGYNAPHELEDACMGDTFAQLEDLGHGSQLRISLLSSLYIFLLLPLNLVQKPGMKFAATITAYSGFLIIITYLYQFSLLTQWLSGMSTSTLSYIGLHLTSPEVTITLLLWPHLVVFIHGVFLMHTFNWGKRMKRFMTSIDPNTLDPITLPAEEEGTISLSPAGSVDWSYELDPRPPSYSRPESHPTDRGPPLQESERSIRVEGRESPINEIEGDCRSTTITERDRSNLFIEIHESMEVSPRGPHPREHWGYYKILTWSLAATQFFMNEVPVRYNLHLLLAVLCISVARRYNTMWGLMDTVVMGIVACLGYNPFRTHIAWTILSLFMSIIFLFQYSLLVGLPTDFGKPQWLSKVDASNLCNYLGIPTYEYLHLNLEVLDMVTSFVIVFFMGFIRLPGNGYIEGVNIAHQHSQGGFTKTLKSVWSRVIEIRTDFPMHRQISALLEVLPHPKNHHDFTQSSRHPLDVVKYYRYHIPLSLSIMLMFMNGAKSTHAGLSLFNLVYIVLSLFLFQLGPRLTWIGNRIWKYVVRFHYTRLFVEALFQIPALQALLEIEGTADLVGLGYMFPVLLNLTMAAIYLQYLNFDNTDYIFILHESQRKKHLMDLRSQMHSDFERLKVGKFTADAIQASAERRQRLLDIRRHRAQREAQLRGKYDMSDSFLFTFAKDMEEPPLRQNPSMASKRDLHTQSTQAMAGSDGVVSPTAQTGSMISAAGSASACGPNVPLDGGNKSYSNSASMVMNDAPKSSPLQKQKSSGPIVLEDSLRKSFLYVPDGEEDNQDEPNAEVEVTSFGTSQHTWSADCDNMTSIASLAVPVRDMSHSAALSPSQMRSDCTIQPLSRDSTIQPLSRDSSIQAPIRDLTIQSALTRESSIASYSSYKARDPVAPSQGSVENPTSPRIPQQHHLTSVASIHTSRSGSPSKPMTEPCSGLSGASCRTIHGDSIPDIPGSCDPPDPDPHGCCGQCLIGMIEGLTGWLKANSQSQAFDKFECTQEGRNRSEAFGLALREFIFSYTGWYCYIAILYNFIFKPSLPNAFLPATIFGYALLFNPRSIYWELSLFYVELVILVKSLWVTFSPQLTNSEFGNPFSDLPDRGAPNSEIPNFLDDIAFEFVLGLLIAFHLKALRRNGLWREFSLDEAIPLPHLPQLPNRLRFLGRDFSRTFLTQRTIGKDFYFAIFTAQLASFFGLLLSYFSIIGSSNDIFSSIQNNLLPGPLVVAQVGFFTLIVADRAIYLYRSLFAKIILHYFCCCLYFYAWYKLYLAGTGIAKGSLDFLFCSNAMYLILSALQIQNGYPYIVHNRLTEGYSDLRHWTYLTFRIIPFVFELRSLLDWTITSTSLKFWYWLKLEDIHHELILARGDRFDTARWNRPLGKPFALAPKLYLGLAGFLSLALIIFMPLLLYSSFSPALGRNAVDSVAVTLRFSGSPPLFQTWTRKPIFIDLEANPMTLSRDIFLTRPSLPADFFSYDVNLQVIELLSYSKISWNLSPPARRELLQMLKDLNTTINLDLQIEATRLQGMGGPIFETIQTWPITSPKTRKELVTMLEAKNQSRGPQIALPSFYAPFMRNSPKGISDLPRVPSRPLSPNETFLEEEGGRQDCYLTMEYEEGVQYAWFQCTQLFMKGNGVDGDEIDPEVYTVEEINCFNGTGPCPQYDSRNASSKHSLGPMYFVVMSDMVPSGTGIGGLFEKFSIITLYTTFIGVIARVLRWTLTGKAHRVPLEDMKDPTRLITLVEDIKYARSERDLTLEEELYNELITIYQSTELMKLYTTPADELTTTSRSQL